MLFDTQKITIDWEGRPLTLETGRMARLADAAVLATYGETTVLATVCADKNVREGQDFFPLTVNYQEKYYAAGRIPGGFFKREGRPTEKETLTSRLIDRPIRPLFVEGFKNEVQVIPTVLSYDGENDPDIIAMIAASAALTLSGLPFLGPIGAARVGVINDEIVINPTQDQLEDTKLDLVVAGTAEAIMMVESEAYELSEDTMLEAVMSGHKSFQAVINAIIDLAELSANEPWDFEAPDHSDLQKQVADLVGDDLGKAYKIPTKQERQAAIGEAKEKAIAALAISEDNPEGANPLTLKDVLKSVESDIVREDILSTGERIDGRKTTDVREIASEVTVLPRTHGSALFTRGDTQALAVTTLGTSDEQQMIDGLDGTHNVPFMLHYNFPPYSVGETGRMGGTNRRETGHGKLAWRALQAVLPKGDEFPYTIRIVSEVLGSNGSSSMATVCGSSLAMMDAGVPITRPVAGIAMGLIKDGDRYAVLSDILGDEDHLGDMDFKVAGTTEGVTTMQMDIKIAGITEEIMKQALQQAKDGRMHILGEMGKALGESRDEVSGNAPQMDVMSVPKDKIRDVIGSGGKTIREIVEVTGAKVNIDDDGTVQISAMDKDSIEAARKWIHELTAEPEVGEVYKGKVVSTKDFGAFVNFFGSKDGLVHISNLTDGRVKNTTDVVKEGDEIWVKLLGFDDRGKTRLSMKHVDQETGEPREPGGEKRDQDGDDD